MRNIKYFVFESHGGRRTLARCKVYKETSGIRAVLVLSDPFRFLSNILQSALAQVFSLGGDFLHFGSITLLQMTLMGLTHSSFLDLTEVPIMFTTLKISTKFYL